MNKYLGYSAIVIFSVFVGSQITEGVLLVPYWQSLESTAFYEYYRTFGPGIGQFYTVLTILAALLPFALLIYFYNSKSQGIKYAQISFFFAVLFVACFYIYFKGANESFYNSSFDSETLAKELVTWRRWHWGRVILELMSLICLIISIHKHKDSKVIEASATRTK